MHVVLKGRRGYDSQVMQVKATNTTVNETVLTIVATEKELAPIKQHVLSHFQDKVKVQGFRAGNVPPELLEKHVDSNTLQTEFLGEAIEQLYVAAAQEQKLRPVDRPNISIKKFVPFTSLEFEATVPVIGAVKLPDYKKIKKAKPAVKVTDGDVKEVVASLQNRLAEKTDVARAAKAGDQVWIDFSGVDAKTKEPINGADGKDYPLAIGSKVFIPGFEEELIGTKAGQDKTFTLTFPKDYGVKALANRKVTFTVHVTKVQAVKEPKADDAFAAQAGPFKTLADLKADIRKQLTVEKQQRADRDFESDLIKQISDKSKLSVPDVLVRDQAARMLQEIKQNLVYRGQTIKEFLEAEGYKDEETYTGEVLETQAKDRVKASLVLAEIAELEGLDVTTEELDIRIQLLKGQYQDEKMQTELDKPENRREIAGRLLTEKTVQKLVGYATTK